MGDPVSVSRHAREAISDYATAMIVEPFANDRVQDNLNPVGRVMRAGQPGAQRPRPGRSGR